MKKSLLFMSLAVILFSSCRFVTGKRIRGNGSVKTEERSTGAFDGVASHGSFDVYVSTGPQSVKIEAEGNLLPYIETHLNGSVLHIETKKNTWLNNSRGIRIYIACPDFKTIHSYGSGDITGQSKITNASNLDLSVSGSADIKMDVDAPAITSEMNGSGDINLRGATKSFTGEIRGSGNIRAMDLTTDESTIKIYGSGNADVFVSGKLDIHVAGSGDVRYKGDARVSSSIAGSGKVKKID
jgi:hypothetical protein